MRLNITLLIQMFNICLTTAIIRRFLVAPLLKILNVREQHKAAMRARVVNGELEVKGVQRSIESDLKIFCDAARQTIKRECVVTKDLAEDVEKKSKVSKKPNIPQKVTSEDVNAFTERVLDGFV